MTATPDLANENSIGIPDGTEYATAIARLLFMARGHRDYYIDFPDTGIPTRGTLMYTDEPDWYRAAEELAASIGRRILPMFDDKGKVVYRLVREDSPQAKHEERQLALELAYALGYADVDGMLESISSLQWKEWQSWLRERKIRVPLGCKCD